MPRNTPRSIGRTHVDARHTGLPRHSIVRKGRAEAIIPPYKTSLGTPCVELHSTIKRFFTRAPWGTAQVLGDPPEPAVPARDLAGRRVQTARACPLLPVAGHSAAAHPQESARPR